MIGYRLLALSLLLAPLTLAQIENEDGSGYIPDFPTQCTDACQPMESYTQQCASIDDGDDEAAALACACNPEFGTYISQCGDCIIGASGTQTDSASIVQQLAISYTRSCGLPLTIDSVSPQVSSVLAAGGAGYESYRESLTASDPDSTATSTDDLAAITSSTFASGSSPGPTSTGASSTETSSTGASSTSAASASSTQPADSGTSALKASSASLMLLAVLVVDSPSSALVTPSGSSKIPNLGSLQERVAKLNLIPTSTSSASPSPPPPGGVRTGAATKISDKISRFQANAEPAPLMPSGGSFGLAPARPSGSKDRGEKPRVASLGVGRATVPLNVVKPTRSASTGNATPTRASDAGSAGSGRSQAGGSKPGSTYEEPSAAGTAPRTPTDTTPIPSPTASAGSMLEKQLGTLFPPGARTPGAVSVSSMIVETGSIASDGGRTSSEIDVTAANLADVAGAEPSPLSSPLVSGITVPASSSSVSSMDGIAPARASSPVLSKGPLDYLRSHPSRSGSMTSMSSLVVEAPPEDVADLSEVAAGSMSGASEPVGLGVVTPTPVEGSDSASQAGARDNEVDKDAEEQRMNRTNAELVQYEADEQDPTAHGPGPAMMNNGDEAQEAPVLSTWQTDSPRKEEMSQNGTSSGMPKVKCSDCGMEVDLMELADHSCAPSQLPPALTSPPASPKASRSSRSAPTTPPSPSRAIPDGPGEPLDHSILNVEPLTTSPHQPRSTPPTSPRNLASSIRANLSRPASQHSILQSTAKLDAFVPQTDSLVPDDVLDFYGADDDERHDDFAAARDEFSSFGSAERSAPSVPQDIDDDSPLVPQGAFASAFSSAPSIPRSQSQPTTRAQQLAPEPRSNSVYGGNMPGLYDSGDDDEGGDGGYGSVTIVRTTASHRA
ncbi:hypothetical protein JCM21900_001232 [Sporobolomyces salmonicolor]